MYSAVEYANPMTARPSKRVLVRLIIVLCLILLVAFMSGCRRSSSGAGSSASPTLRINALSASTTAARIGDTVTVRWNYANARLLQRQTFRVMSLSIEGISLTSQELPINQRETSLTFNGPVTIEVLAVDNRGKATDAAFDIKLDSQYSFTMKGVRASHANYPRLGQPRGRNPVMDIEFSRFFGVYDVADGNGLEDGVIDGLRQLRSSMPPSQDFFGHSFRVEENQRFGFKIGSAFPLLEPGYLLTAEGGQFFGAQTRADAVAFAGKIIYDGTSATDRKTGLRFRRNIATFEPLFATIDLRTGNNGQLFVTDVDLGNANQGLTVSVFHGETLGRHLGTWSTNYNVQASGFGELQGSVKAARLGFGVTTSNGGILTSVVDGVELPGVFVGIDSIDWKLPLHPDTDLSNL